MQKGRQATDIDRKLAIYYHPLFQQVIKNLLLLFNLPANDIFEIGLLQFVQFNLKLQKSLLPGFEIDNALVSALNDWVKEVAECLSYEGMVSTSKCQEITSQNFNELLLKELEGIHINIFTDTEEYIRMMTKLASHDAFKLLGVKINKEVFNKFIFDLCSTWCEFLDIELFSYFLIGIYIQVSKGEKLGESSFKENGQISAIDLQFMEEFEEIKALYAKTRKKELRYYRAWCEWNYLRINQIGQSLILQLDQIHDHDPRILQLALVFEKSIQVINEEITNQNIAGQPELSAKVHVHTEQQGEKGEFLIAKKIEVPEREKKDSEAGRESPREIANYQIPQEQQNVHNFEIEIDSQGNMYLKKIVKLPILGTRIDPQPGQRKEQLKQQYLYRKRQQIRHMSNLYRRMQNMKVRLQHNIKNDPYSFKESAKLAERTQFYQQNDVKVKNNYSNIPIQKIIHGKMQPEKALQPQQIQGDYRTNFKAELMQEKQPIRKNQNYIHRVMAPAFVTDQKHNISYTKGESNVYGVGPYAQKRDLKIGLPRLKFLQKKVVPLSSYHVVGKLTRDRAVINQRVKSFSTTEQPMTRIDKQRQQFRHVWTRYIDQQQMNQLNNYNDFYSKLEQAKKLFSAEHQSNYRLNLKNIILYDNKRYEMGGVITKKQEEYFYQRIRKLLKRDARRMNRRKRKTKLREYRKVVGGKDKRRLFEDIFISYHRQAIKDINQERKNVSFAK